MQVLRPSWNWMLAIVFAALVIRLQSVAFGLPALNDPDELMFELGAVRMLRGPTLDPGWFGHPATTTMYILALVDIGVFLTGYLAGWFASVQQFGDAIYANPTWVILPGRIAMTLFAIGTIILTYRLASRMFDRRGGLVAALILAVSPLHITYSQIIRSDMMACFFLLLTLLAALDIVEEGRWRNYVRASVWIGLAVATKWPFALAILAVAGAAAWRAKQEPAERPTILLRLAGCALLSVLFLLLASPYLAIDYSTVLRNLSGEGQARHLGANGGSPLHNLLWYGQSIAMSGIGPIGCVLALGGLSTLRRVPRAAVILLPVALGFLLVLSAQNLVWERWGLPLIPIAALLAGSAAIAFTDWFAQRFGRQAARAALGTVILLTLAPLLWRAAGNARERLNDTRQIAAQWAREHIRPGRSVMVEHFAFDITNQPWHFVFPLGDLGCIDALALLHGKISYQPIDAARAGRSNVDYGTMSPARRSTCQVDYAILTQYERYKAERDQFPAEYDAYKELISRGRVVAHFVPVAGRSGGPAVTIVRFAAAP